MSDFNRCLEAWLAAPIHSWMMGMEGSSVDGHVAQACAAHSGADECPAAHPVPNIAELSVRGPPKSLRNGATVLAGFPACGSTRLPS